MAGPGDWLTRNEKTRSNYGTGLTKCFDSCQCIVCRRKKANEEANKLKDTNDTTNSSV